MWEMPGWNVANVEMEYRLTACVRNLNTLLTVLK